MLGIGTAEGVMFILRARGLFGLVCAAGHLGACHVSKASGMIHVPNYLDE